MMKKNKIGLGIIIGLLIGLIIGLAIYDNILLDNNNEQIENKDENNKKEETKDKILLLTTEELNEKLIHLNDSDILLFQDFESKAYDYVNKKVILNTNLFDDDIIKNKIAILMGNIETEFGSAPTVDLPVYVNFNEFSNIYEEIWQEKLDSSKLEDGKYYVYDIPSGVGISNIQVKAKDIIKENDTYIIKTYIGILIDPNIINDLAYNYNNNYEGELRFKKSSNYYMINSFIIKEIQ